MITLISFILVLAGALNWFSIGALQYDFVAGLFGSQASMFSRIIYFLVGVAGVWLLIQAFRGKGKIKINDDGFNKSKKSKDILEEKKVNKQENNYYVRNDAEAGASYVDDRRYINRRPLPKYIDVEFNEPPPERYNHEYLESKERREDFYQDDF